MKKSLIALAALAATSAFAQSTVTIDGRIELGVIKNTGKSATMDVTNGFNQIRFLGSEDLGGGLKANFTLAQRFSPESGLFDGTGGTRPMFQGESTVGLSGGFGSVKIGRALTAMQAPFNGSDPWGTRTVAATAMGQGAYSTDISFAGGSGLARTDGIFYTSPNISGFTVSGTLGLKQSASSGTATTGQQNLTSLWLAYSAGPISAGIGLEENRSKDEIMGGWAAYNLGVATVAAGFANIDTAATAGSKATSWNLGVTAPMGAITLKLGYKQDTAENTKAKTKKTGVGAEYTLSKRTMLYTGYGRTQTTTSTTGMDIGIVHTF